MMGALLFTEKISQRTALAILQILSGDPKPSPKHKIYSIW
jgi:hypothetical protein